MKTDLTYGSGSVGMTDQQKERLLVEKLGMSREEACRYLAAERNEDRIIYTPVASVEEALEHAVTSKAKRRKTAAA